MEKLNTLFYKLFMFILLIAVIGINDVHAQKKKSSSEVGITIGAANILSDLGGSPDIGRGFVADLEFATTRPVIGGFFRQNFNSILSARASVYYAQVTGDDALIPETTMGGTHRKYRNLSFKSPILEFSGMVEINLLPYLPGSSRNRFAPYVMAGVGVFHFDPKANYNGQWIRLQPLGTEGQGLPNYPGKEHYSLTELCFPVGGGIKININKKYALNIEVSHRFTTTDYIDDVSTTYVDEADFYRAYGPTKGALIAGLSDRSSGERTASTAPGAQRGDPSDFDQYTFAGLFTFSYKLGSGYGTKGLYCPKKF